jgi:antitoxin (DNA-binding transcriptional repressor) of toxin-antitoxin stability system
MRRFVVAMGKSWKLQIVGTNAFFRRVARRQMLVDIILKGLYKVTIMKLIAIQDLKRPRRLKERLLAEKELLLTSDGRPVAVLVNVDASEDPETMIQSIRDSRSRLALSRVREQAARSGVARLSLAEINREIAATRKARRAARK